MVGNCINGCMIINNYIIGNIDGNNYVGGIIGNLSQGVFENNHFEGNIIGNDSVGGIVGWGSGTSIIDSSVKGIITGNNNVGGLAGRYANVNGSYFNGLVNGGGNNVGGLIGLNGSCNNSYSVGSITGNNNVGGLIGFLDCSYQSIVGSSNSFSVTNIFGDENIGGLIGNNDCRNSRDSYWDILVSDQNEGYGTGRVTHDMVIQNNYLDWDFDNIWTIQEGTSYPYLRNNLPNPFPIANIVTNPYPITINNGEIWYIEQLAKIGLNSQTRSIDYKLMRDLDFNNNSHYLYPQLNKINWTELEGWLPIGSFNSPFTGNFDGNGYKISNMYIKRIRGKEAGLFGSISDSSEIKNLGLVNINVGKDSNLGGLVGISFGTIKNSYVQGYILAGERVGGVVGILDAGIIEESHFSGSIDTMGSFIGGLVGSIWNGGTVSKSYADSNIISCNGANCSSIGGLVGVNAGNINQSYSLGNILGYMRVGGLVGTSGTQNLQQGNIINSYSHTNVTRYYSPSGASRPTGGLIGVKYYGDIKYSYSTGIGGFLGFNALNSGIISNCYWDINTSNRLVSDGGTGKTTPEMKTQGTFTDWNFTDIWEIDSTINNGYPYLQDNSPQ